MIPQNDEPVIYSVANSVRYIYVYVFYARNGQMPKSFMHLTTGADEYSNTAT